MFLKPPVMKEIDVTGLFGEAYKGKQRVWEFRFGIEFEAVFASSDRPYGTLEDDFVNVPIVANLTESVDISPPTFIVAGPKKNIFFESFTI